jgi:hypothetical protein
MSQPRDGGENKRILLESGNKVGQEKRFVSSM